MPRGGRRGRAKSSDVQEDNVASSTGDFNTDLESFAREVLNALAQDNLPPFANYYQLYFDKLLEDKPYEFKKEVYDFLESESSNEDEKQMRLEQQLQEGFSISKDMLQNVAKLYKSVNTMMAISKKRSSEAGAINNPSAIKNLTHLLQNDLEKLTIILDKQGSNIKNLYNKSAKIIKEVQGETIYDAQYGIFNKRYIADQIKKEIVQMEKFNHSSSLMVARLANKISSETTDKQLAMINRTISKLILKTSRRSDIVGYIGNNIFGMLLKHTDELNAIRAAGRLADMLGDSYFFLGDNEVKLQIKVGISLLSSSSDSDAVISAALDVIEEVEKDENTTYGVAKV